MTKNYDTNDSNITFRVNSDLKKDFDEIVKQFNMTSSGALLVFMRQVVIQKQIPFIISAVPTNKNDLRD